MTTRFAADGRKVSLLGYGAMRLPTVDGGNAAGRVGKAVAGASAADTIRSAPETCTPPLEARIFTQYGPERSMLPT